MSNSEQPWSFQLCENLEVRVPFHCGEFQMRLRQSILLLFAIAYIAALPIMAKAQSLTDASGFVASTAPQADLVYTRPTQEIKLRNYVFDAFGPYPISGAAVVAGVGQMDNTPAAWGQGMAGYGKRFGSALGIAAISTTTRYALAEAFKETHLTTAVSAKAYFRGCAMP